MEEIKTERLHLKKIKADDYPHLFMLWHDRELIKFTYHIYMETLEDSRLRVLKVIDRYSKIANTAGPFLIFNQDKFIGYCGFEIHSENPKTIEIFYILKKEFHRFGYGSEVSKKMVTTAFDELGAEIVCAEVVKDNIASIKLLEKTGFTLKSYAENKFYKGADYHDLLFYSINKASWLK